MSVREKYHASLNVILRDFGYRFSGDRLYSLPVAYIPERLVPHRFSDVGQAAEYLIPIVHDDEFYNRLKAAEKRAQR